MFKLDSLNSQVQGYLAKPAKAGKLGRLCESMDRFCWFWDSFLSSA